MPLRGDILVCAILGLTALPAAAGQRVCALPGSAEQTGAIPGLSAPRQAALDSLCQTLRQGFSDQAQDMTPDTAPDTAGTAPDGLYLQLVGTSRSGMTLRLVLRRGGQETPGEALTISTTDADRPSPASLQRLAELLIKTAPLP